MSKKTSKAKSHGGPFLACAVFCDSILEDKVGVLTPVRIVDKCTITLPHDAPKDVPRKVPILITQQALIILRTGDAPGTYKLGFVLELANGKRVNANEQEVTLKKDATGGGGAHVRTTVAFPAIGPGVYWLDIYLDGKRLTRMPFTVVVKREAKPETKSAKP